MKMMMNNIPRDWHVHGRFGQTELLAVIPRHGLHYLAGKAGKERDAVIADIATATAGDMTICGLSAPDKAGARSSLSGFFGLPTGAATGVAVIASAEHADSLSRNIAANALARGVCRPLPVAVLGIAGVTAQHLTGAHARIAELVKWFEAEHGMSMGLVILDLALPAGELLAFQRQGRAVLVAGDAAPAALDGVILEVGENRITLAKPAGGEPSWAREFALDVVSIGGNDVHVIRPGKPVTPSPVWQATAPAARKAVAPEPELPITSKVVLIVSRGELSEEQKARWTDDDYSIVQSQQAALPKPGEIVGGRREIVVAGDDQLPTELRARATRLEWEATARGVANDIIVRVAA
jgi:hypothetical protein